VLLEILLGCVHEFSHSFKMHLKLKFISKIHLLLNISVQGNAGSNGNIGRRGGHGPAVIYLIYIASSRFILCIHVHVFDHILDIYI
jgi:hypothetical protein